ncbi:uncharacterized protein LOC135471601 [Liolophura sinensis]|uniref:uncharacterized protein LOC135471601 n=1 Tax=Liolophura sinensis TaxID=3198878 RepID=UPI0031587DED
MNVLRFRPRNTAIAAGIFLTLAICGLVYLGGSAPSLSPGVRDTLGKGSRHFSAQNKLSHSRLLHEWGTIPIVVVEEHHEVIPHWYSAVKDGIVNPKGNLLIHIDGHSDSAPPIFFDGYPKDFYPRTKDHLTVMMQRNDAFIVEAVLSGLISRYVWIWPKWDSKNHEEPYEASAMLLGVVDTLYKNLDNTRVKSCCMCEPDEEMNPKSCVFLNITSEAPEDSSKVDPKDCDIQAVMVQEIIREDVALEMAQNGSLFHNMTDSERENVILDIDEDYYGCEAAVQPVLDQKLTMVTIDKIDRFVDQIFCPETTEEESSVDKVLAEMISALIRVKSCELEKKPSCPKGNLEFYTTKVRRNTALVESTCVRQRNKRFRLWGPFFKLVDSLTVNQLRQLREMGFCFRTTPKAHDFGSEDEGVFLTCHGANTPNRSVVIFHSPTMKEVEQRTHLLQTFLQSTKKRILPSLVTVCRSMRDGYTPRKFFRRIEKDVLTSVDEAFPNSKVHYDRDLMGGKRGWPGRHNV